MKKFFYSVFFLLISLWVKPVFAGNDITITCNSSQCFQSPVLPLFSETNIYPGFSASQKVFINNNRNAPCDLYLKGISQIPGILADKISLNITGINNDFSLIDYSLTNLLAQDINPVYLGKIPKNSQYSYNWSATLNSDADNNYADKSTNFAINFNFTCDEEPKSFSGDGGQIAGVSTSSDTPKCTNSYPLSPTNLIANANADGSVTLNWSNTLSDHTGYLIAFGTSSGDYQYGAPDVGNVTNYTVKSLTPGAQYCFYVRSLNGCMPGERTPEYCINPGSNIVATNVAPEGFRPGVLGVTTDAETPSITSSSDKSSSGQVLGESQTTCQKQWLPLLFLLAFLINFILISRFSPNWLTLLLIPTITLIFDYYLSKNSCCYGQKWLCTYYWVGNILSFLIPSVLSKKRTN